jgi:hypothetical protein
MISPPDTPVTTRMQSLIQQWNEHADNRALFLNCYLLMTNNMLAAIDRREFDDPAWVDQLLCRFADYYFNALEAYERDPATTAAVWRLAHDAARNPDLTAIQKMLAGISAHINYDLVLALADVLRPEWDNLTDDRRAARYADHCRVNAVIGRSIDAVQDQVLDPAMPIIKIVDRLMGPLDEMMMSRLIAHWRDVVWQNAARLLDLDDDLARARLIHQIEGEALGLGRLICI